MKRFILVVVWCVICCTSMCFATTANSYDFASGDAIYINTEDELNKMMQNVDEDALYKEAYEKKIEQSITAYKDIKQNELFKAKVAEAGAVQTYYYDDDNGSTSKAVYQDVTFEMLEGEYKGEKIKAQYIMSIDSFDHMRMNELKVGKKVNVVLYEYENKVFAFVMNSDVAFDRFGAFIILTIIAVLFIIIFLGKAGLKILPQLILIFDLILLVFVPEIYAGKSPLWLTSVISAGYILVENLIKLGPNSKSVASAIATIAVTVCLSIVYALFYNFTNMIGLTYEIANMLEVYPLDNIDFYELNMAVFILMSVVAVSNVSCQTVRVYAENSDDVAKQKIQKYVSGMLPIILCLILFLCIQKYTYLMISKYSWRELMNSEMLIGELVRGVLLVIGVTATTQVAEYTKKWFA